MTDREEHNTLPATPKAKQPRERKRVQKKFKGWDPKAESEAYDVAFYEKHRKYYLKGIANFAAWLEGNFQFSSLADLGCGQGDFVVPFVNKKKVLGIDFSTGAKSGLSIPEECYREHDLTTPLPDDMGQFDVVVSLETYEHIPEELESVFLDNLVKLEPKHLIVSAAAPGQIGRRHYNCRGPDEITTIISQRGFVKDEEKTQTFQQIKRLASFYRKNTVVFNRS